MDQYATVVFTRDEREKQREFLLAMDGAEIIQISKEDVDRWYKEDSAIGDPGCENHIVLHGDEEVNRFKCVMKTFFPDRNYYISEEPGSKEFKEWLFRRENREKNTPLDEKGGTQNESNLS